MDVKIVNPFIRSVCDTFSTMLGAEAQRGQLALSRNGSGKATEIVAFIGLAGDAKGTVALSIPSKTAIAVVERLLGSDQCYIDDNVRDCVAELVNIIAGGAKAELSEGLAKPLTLSLPTVVRGNGFEIEYPQNTVWLEVPFDSELGSFTLRVTMEKEPERS